VDDSQSEEYGKQRRAVKRIQIHIVVDPLPWFTEVQNHGANRHEPNKLILDYYKEDIIIAAKEQCLMKTEQTLYHSARLINTEDQIEQIKTLKIHRCYLIIWLITSLSQHW